MAKTVCRLNLLVCSQVTEEKAKIDGISSRLEVAKVPPPKTNHHYLLFTTSLTLHNVCAQTKVARISGSTKAITVHSSAKYPAPQFLSDYSPLYVDLEKKGAPVPLRTRFKIEETPSVNELPGDSHTHTPLLSLSLSLTHTHTHTHERERERRGKAHLIPIIIVLSYICPGCWFSWHQRFYSG